MPDATQYQKALDLFDAANALDPTLEPDEHDQPVASELLYARRMTAWLTRLYPNASEPLKLAARAQHIRRWHIPRNTYAIDRPGYHAWRTALYAFHAQTAGKILRDAGYDEQTISRVGSLLRKERLKADPDAQALEDVACLVFLEYEFAPFAPQHDEAKILNILRRTWAKMSDTGRRAAMELAPNLPESARRLIVKAVEV